MPDLAFFLFDWGWSNMFMLDQEKISYFEKIVRPLLIYGLLIFLFRILGKREIAQLNPVDFVLLLLVSNTVQNAIIGEDTSVIGGAVGVITLLFANRALAIAKYRHPLIEKMIEGGSRSLISRGRIEENALRRELLTREDLDVVAHKEGYESAADLEKCIIDPNGEFFVEGKGETIDEHFRHQILKKIDQLSTQIDELKTALKKV